MSIAFDNSYHRELEGLYVPFEPEDFPAPELLAYNRELAAELGLPEDLAAKAARVFSGQEPLPGMQPIAQAYAGHQFGHFNPQLGDGRAVLLGELIAPSGRVDLQLKGSGRTPFSRGGDGRATVGPVLREYLIGEAMHALGVPTTRALAAVRTGEQVWREVALPGAVLTRVAASHLRIGTFEFFAARQAEDKLVRLVDYALQRHYPEVEPGDRPAAALLERVIEAQARLVAKWMAIGFVHGVMNTDNCTISGETIDYGPCAFMEAYDPATVFSSIDRHGRYAYGQQPAIAGWNLARLAEALLPLLAEEQDEAIERASALLENFGATYNQAWLQAMRAKLGLATEGPADLDLVVDLLALLHANQVDYTRAFRALAEALRGRKLALLGLVSDVAALDAWLGRWHARLAAEAREPEAAAEAMHAVNPVYIPRNHKVEGALDAAIAGELGPFEALLAAVRDPYVARPGREAYAEPAPAGFGPYVTYCGT